MRVLALLIVTLMAVPVSAQAEDGEPRRRSIGSRFSSKLLAPATLRDAMARHSIQAVDSSRRPARRAQSASSWVMRHPACLGSLIGFFGGFLIGYSQGDDGVFSDFDGSFSGLMLGGVGAGFGAIVGLALGR